MELEYIDPLYIVFESGIHDHFLSALREGSFDCLRYVNFMRPLFRRRWNTHAVPNSASPMVIIDRPKKLAFIADSLQEHRDTVAAFHESDYSGFEDQSGN